MSNLLKNRFTNQPAGALAIILALTLVMHQSANAQGTDWKSLDGAITCVGNVLGAYVFEPTYDPKESHAYFYYPTNQIALEYNCVSAVEHFTPEIFDCKKTDKNNMLTGDAAVRIYLDVVSQHQPDSICRELFRKAAIRVK